MQPYESSFLCDQAQRTKPTRQFFYTHLNWESGLIALDLGCGEGFVTVELANQGSYTHAVGVDIDPTMLTKSLENCDGNFLVHFLLCDAMHLPIRGSCVSFALSHFTLMWVADHQKAIEEIYRILTPQGFIAAIEPDYGGRIEASKTTGKADSPSKYPIIQYLLSEGANPYLGSQLPSAFSYINFRNVQFGVLAWQYDSEMASSEIDSEAKLLQSREIKWSKPTLTYTPIWWILGTKHRR